MRWSMAQPGHISTQGTLSQGLRRRAGYQLHMPAELGPGRQPARCTVFFCRGGHLWGSMLAVADGSHAFVQVSVHSLTVLGVCPGLMRGGAGNLNGYEKEAETRAGQASKVPQTNCSKATGQAPGHASTRWPPSRPHPRGRGQFAHACAAAGMYLVDPANIHMLVSKAKPYSCRHMPPHGEAANGSLDCLQFIGPYMVTWITVVIPELIHATSAPTCLARRDDFIRSKSTGPQWPSPLVAQDNFGLITWPWLWRRIFQVLYQVPHVGALPS